MPQSTLAIITEMEVVTIEVYILGPAKTLLPRSITIYIVQACKLNSVILHNCSFLSLFFFFCFVFLLPAVMKQCLLGILRLNQVNHPCGCFKLEVAWD